MKLKIFPAKAARVSDQWSEKRCYALAQSWRYYYESWTQGRVQGIPRWAGIGFVGWDEDSVALLGADGRQPPRGRRPCRSQHDFEAARIRH